MTDKRLNIAFLWHMHQPLYKDPATGEYTLPWVLFHATKDYYDMAAILEEFPDVHQTFNVVPCLIEQLNEYSSGKALDKYRELSKKPASRLTRDDKAFIIQYFFQANWDYMIKPLPRYWELLKKRGASDSKDEIQHVLRYFTEEDYQDLQVLFNLVWIDPVIRDRDPFLSSLYSKGAGFTEAEKLELLDKQIEIVGTVLPKYREMMDKGIIEVSTTPYYHPIMPLLCDSFSAKEAMPDLTLPKERFMHPEDAERQIDKGIALYEQTFGRKPKGMWPSEGSVSMDILPIVTGAGIEWLASDEEILSNSLKRPIRRDTHGNCYDPFLYKAYSIDADGKKVSLLFRDHVLSDLIGFDYAKMDAEAASNDMVTRLNHIYDMLEEPENHIVSIILDGENAWEHFKNDGRDFLTALYSKLSGHHKLRCVTISEFLEDNGYREGLNWLYPGSWISHNFKIWIGHVEDNTAWDYIAEARGTLAKHEESLKPAELEERKDALAQAWEEVYAAEGSDWFWWYGEEHTSLSDEHFDALFRKHIKRVYTLIDLEPPDHLEIPISSEAKGYVPPIVPSAFIKPSIDGLVSNYFEWLSAGRLERHYFGSAMHRELQGNGVIDGVSYGFSKDSLFFRFDYLEELVPFEGEWSFTVNFLHPKPVKITASVKGKAPKARLSVKTDKKWTDAGPLNEIASDTVVELAISLDALGASKGDEIRLFINIDGNERGMERWPVKGFLIFQVPAEDFEQQNWIV